MDAKEYREKTESLFKRWKEKKPDEELKIDHAHSVFITDGVVCPENWFQQTVRPLYLLKEAYGGETDWNLIKDHLLCSEKKMSTMWKNVTKWTEGIFHTTSDSIMDYREECAQFYGNDWLKKIAVVNVKKSGGQKQSDMSDIERYAAYDQKELLEEIELCDPTVIICGYTVKALNIITGQEIKDYDKPDDNWNYSMTVNHHKVMVIDYYHPASQFPRLINYYAITHLYQLALRRNEATEEKSMRSEDRS